MRAREPHAADAIDGADRAQQVGEQRPQASGRIARVASRELQVAPVAVDVLAEQRDLGDAVGGQRLDLGDDVVERTADLGTAHGRDDAERAVVVAADLDRDPRVVRRLAARGQRRREHRVVVDHGGVEDLGERATRARASIDELGGAMHVVRAEHDVDVRRPLADDLAILLGQAAGHHDLAPVALALPRLEMAEVAVELVVGVLADAARVEHDDVGVVLRSRRHQPVGLEQPGDALRVVLVHLAPEGAHDVAPRHTARG